MKHLFLRLGAMTLVLTGVAGYCGEAAAPPPGARDRSDTAHPPHPAGSRPAPAYHSRQRPPAVTSIPGVACNPDWAEKSPVDSPWPRRNFALAHDEGRGETVMYGGFDGYDYTYETWVFDGTDWVPKGYYPAPNGAWLPGMAYDRARGQIVLFGGYDGYYYGYVNETWVWDGTTWTQKTPATPPSPRQMYSMGYDSARQEVVLFGGSGDAGDLNDTWTWDGVNWTQRFPANSPPLRGGQRMAFDEARSEMILFGGYDGAGYLADTWAWNGTDWTQRSPAATPGARYFQAMAYDAARGFIVLYGGYDGAVRLDDSWYWDGGNWQPLAPSTVPPARSGHAAAYDAARGETLLYGGWNGAGNYRGDTWAWSFGAGPFVTGASANQCPGLSVPLSTQPFLSYQWNLNGNPVGGANGRYFSADQAGDYSVTVTSAACGTQTSPPHTVAITDPCPCLTPPKFDGLASISNPAQSICALELSWPPATLNCGGSVSYQVYRSTLPGFTPSSANRIAGGISAAGYTDFAGLVNNTVYYYVVRSQDDLGNQDSNRVEVSGAPSGPVVTSTFSESFEGAQSGGGFDNAGWLHGAGSGTADWTWSTAQSQTPGHSWHSASQSTAGDRTLATPPLPLTSASALSFWHTHAFEGAPASCYDAGTLEISTNNGGSWSVLPAGAFTSGGYNGTVNPNYGNPLGGKPAWCGGAVGAMTRVDASLVNYAGQTARLRWHAGDDTSTGLAGWYVDSASVSGVGSATACSCPAPAGLPNNGAADRDACAATGVQVSWQPPASWGDGGLGSRSWIVLRDGNPVAGGPCSGMFTESSLNCVDTTGGAEIPHVYSVRAVNGCAAVQTTSGVNARDALDIPHGSGQWVQRLPASRPEARDRHAIVFDAAHGTLLLFGGYSMIDGFLNDTWLWDGAGWTQQFPLNSPTPRHSAAIAYDAARGEVVLFGGTASGSFPYLNDTWVWDGTNWTQKFPAAGPTPGFDGVTAAYDAARGEVVIYGGYTYANFSETWTWNGTTWSKKTPAASPPPRIGAQLVYDPLRAESVMFGGNADTAFFADTWTWNGTIWLQKFPANSPSYRANAAAVFDPVQRKVLLLGGQFYSNVDNHLWMWDGVNWSEQIPSPAPSAGIGTAMAFDPVRGQTVLFSGYDMNVNAQNDETWTFLSAVPVDGLSVNTCPDESVTLSTQPFSGYQWNRNGAAIPGAVAQAFNAATSGNYSVTVTSPSGCAATSAAKPVTINAPCPCEFAGLASAASAGQAGCAVNLNWNPTTSGCGPGVTFNVYRSVLADFSPSPANRIAAGVAATAYADSTSLTGGVKFHYIVRSVTGGGSEDANTVVRSAIPAGPPATGAFADTFEGALSGGGFDRPGWSHASLYGVSDWVWSSAQSSSPTHSWYSASTGSADNVLVMPPISVNGNSVLTFYHTYSFPNCCGWSFLETSTDGGDTWTRLPAAAFTAGGYNCTDEWCNGTLGAMTRVDATLAGFSGQTIRLRWRAVSNGGVAGPGWYVDSVTVSNVNTSASCTGGCTPPAPAITSPVSGCTVGTVPLSVQPFSEYQWYRYLAEIPGAVGQNYDSTSAGEYSVTVTDASGCSAGSPVHPVDIQACCPPVIGNNTATDVNSCASTGVDITWSPPSDWGDGGNSSYRGIYVYRNGTLLNGGGCGNLSAAATSCNDATGVIGTPYPYTVEFFNGCYRSGATGGATAADVNNNLPASWLQLSPAASPGNRSNHAMSADTRRNEIVLFGGNGLADTWVFRGGNWVQRSPAASPPARYNHAMAYDAARGNTILFGGATGTLLNDTWSWDGINWSLLNPASRPAARTGAAMAYDAARGEIVLFGGSRNTFPCESDTWTWNGTTWTQKFPAVSPPMRCASSMAYDAGRGETVLFGGYDNYGVKLSDTWIWNGSDWMQKSPPIRPLPRAYYAMAYDPSAGQVVMFGGYNGNYVPYNETWNWDGASWSKKPVVGSPAARSGTAMAYDALQSRMILMGGSTPSGAAGDTWGHSEPLVMPLKVVKSGGGSQANFNWINLSGALSYSVYQDMFVNGAFPTVTGTAASGNPGLTVPMPAGNSLFFKIAAANSCGEGPK